MFSLRPSAYLCVLCVKTHIKRRDRRDTQRTQRQRKILTGIKEPIPKMSWLKRTTGLLVMAALFAIGATRISSQEAAKPQAPRNRRQLRLRPKRSGFRQSLH